VFAGRAAERRISSCPRQASLTGDASDGIDIDSTPVNRSFCG
jgi:hypothetical protein